MTQSMLLWDSVTRSLNACFINKCDSCLLTFIPWHAGQSLSKLRSEFLDIRQKFNGRYVRLYGSCDRKGF